jgi:hypothetical protein
MKAAAGVDNRIFRHVSLRTSLTHDRAYVDSDALPV